jgi:hypothetical protein
MTNQELANVLLHHWQLLWPLNPTERIRRIDAIRADLEYQEQLRAVTEQMELAS